jgi:hypothetical protein
VDLWCAFGLVQERNPSGEEDMIVTGPSLTYAPKGAGFKVSKRRYCDHEEGQGPGMSIVVWQVRHNSYEFPCRISAWHFRILLRYSCLMGSVNFNWGFAVNNVSTGAGGDEEVHVL